MNTLLYNILLCNIQVAHDKTHETLKHLRNIALLKHPAV